MANQVATSLYNKLANEFELRQAHSSGVTDTILSGLRKQAFDNFKAKGFPSIKEEDWRFTSLVPFLDTDYSLSGYPAAENMIAEAVRKALIPSLNGYRIVLLNGSIHAGLSLLPPPEMATIVPVKDIIHTEAYKEQLASFTKTEGNTLTALNSAFFSDGFYLEIKKDAVVDKPLEFIHIYTSVENVFFQPRHLVVVNRNAKAEMVETSITLHDRKLV
ncbi:MAG: hypothetical protein H7Y03_09200, partial [Chitinophagaceae bacterium]|nr:hypothetical protein [Chitinophagaceae bacterium]